jgi:hypothetical protein
MGLVLAEQMYAMQDDPPVPFVTPVLEKLDPGGMQSEDAAVLLEDEGGVPDTEARAVGPQGSYKAPFGVQVEGVHETTQRGRRRRDGREFAAADVRKTFLPYMRWESEIHLGFGKNRNKIFLSSTTLYLSGQQGILPHNPPE